MIIYSSDAKMDRYAVRPLGIWQVSLRIRHRLPMPLQACLCEDGYYCKVKRGFTVSVSPSFLGVWFPAKGMAISSWRRNGFRERELAYQLESWLVKQFMLLLAFSYIKCFSHFLFIGQWQASHEDGEIQTHGKVCGYYIMLLPKFFWRITHFSKSHL